MKQTNLISVFAPPDLMVPEGHLLGWRVVGRDLRSYGGAYRWPWPGGVAETPDARPGGSCPTAYGDGLCLAKTARGAAVGGMRLECVLLVAYRPEHILGEDRDKLRVSRAIVLDLVDAQLKLRQGAGSGADLYGANLRGANLRGADLRGADLREADLYRADLGMADIRGAVCGGADLRGADLRGAVFGWDDLRGADSRGAVCGWDFRGADLT